MSERAGDRERDVVLLKGRRRVLGEVSLELLTRRRANIVAVDLIVLFVAFEC